MTDLSGGCSSVVFGTQSLPLCYRHNIITRQLLTLLAPLITTGASQPAKHQRYQHTHTTCVTLDYKYQLSFYPGKHHKHLTLIQCTVIQYKHKTVTCQIKGNNNVGTLSMWVCGLRNDINTFFLQTLHDREDREQRRHRSRHHPDRWRDRPC